MGDHGLLGRGPQAAGAMQHPKPLVEERTVLRVLGGGLRLELCNT